MTITAKLMGTGISNLAALAITGEVVNNLTATGTNQATALLISSDLCIFSTVDSGTGCRLPVGAQQDEYAICNDGANALLIYPPLGGTIGGGAVNASISLAAGSSIKITYQSSLVTRVLDNVLVLASSLGSSLIGFIQSGTGAVIQTVQTKLRKTLSLSDFGPAGDGVTNDRTSFVNVSALGRQFEIEPGDYLISSSITFAVPVIFKFGAKLIIPTGVTVTFNAGIKAGPSQIFSTSGTGLVAFNPGKQGWGYAEWWGAVVGGTDCVAAIEAAHVALVKVKLLGADYFTSRCLVLETQHHTVEGKKKFFNGGGLATTRIVVTSGTENVIRIGPNVLPGGGINSFPQEITIKNLQAARSIAPVISSNCVGILNKFTLYCEILNVRSVESMRGFEFSGTVRTLVRDCYSFRSSAGTGGGTDTYIGYYVNGANVGIGAAGGNASIYIQDCNASMGNFIATSRALYIDQEFSDTYVTNFEDANFDYGIRVVGNGLATINYGNIDLFFTNCVSDQFRAYGLSFEDVGKYGVINVNSGYSACANVGTVVAGVNFSSVYASVALFGHQVIAGPNTNVIGLKAVNCAKIHTDMNAYNECLVGVSLDAVTNSYINDTITNNTNSANQAVKLVASSSNEINCAVVGGAAKIAVGVDLTDGTSLINNIHTSRIDAAALVGGEINKVKINTVQIPNSGLISGNYIIGMNNASQKFQAAGFIGPSILGGTSTTQKLTYQTTSGVGATGADHVFKVGNNGALTPFKILNSGVSQFLPDGTNLNFQIESTGVTAGGFGNAGGLYNARSNTNRFAGYFQYCASDTNGTTLTFGRNRGTVDANTTLNAEDIIGEFNFQTWDGSANRNCAAMIVYADAVQGSGDVPGRFSWFTTPDGSTTRTEGMRLSRNQRLYVGGGVDPTAKVHIGAGGATAGTAPIKLTSGTNLTTPEAGAVEFDGTNYFVTSSSTRYTLAKTLTATAALNFPITVAGASADLTVTVTGASDGDVVALGVPNASTNVNTLFTAFVSAADTVTVRFQNANLATSVDPASGTFRVSVLKY